MITISEYTEGTRTVKVYKTKNSGYSVVVYTYVSHPEYSKSFVTIDAAEDYAQDLVRLNDAV